MYTGHEICKNTLPTSAGLNILWPSPPNICLPIIILTAPPITGIQKGISGGRLYAKSSPVNIALPSKAIFGSLFLIFKNKASLATQASIEIRITFKLLRPNMYMPARPAGKSESATRYIILRLVRPDLICGAGETVKILFGIQDLQSFQAH